MLKGIDISKWNEWKENFANYDFVIIRAMGTNGKDSKLDSHYNNFSGKTDGSPCTNKCYGFYCFPDVTKTPSQEAEEFLSLIGHHIGYALLALDWEASTLSAGVSWALAWLDYIYNKTGVKPLIYGSASELSKNEYKVLYQKGYGLWVAHWGALSPKSGHWGNLWALWQYTSNNGTLDENYFNGTKEAWKKFANPDVKETVTNALYYYVESGDNLTKIAKNFNTTIEKLVELNNIENPDLIYVGQTLRVQ